MEMNHCIFVLLGMTYMIMIWGWLEIKYETKYACVNYRLLYKDEVKWVDLLQWLNECYEVALHGVREKSSEWHSIGVYIENAKICVIVSK